MLAKPVPKLNNAGLGARLVKLDRMVVRLRKQKTGLTQAMRQDAIAAPAAAPAPANKAGSLPVQDQTR